MNALRNLTLIAIVTTAFAACIPNAGAQMTVDKIKVTFSGPVEVPGLVLPTGTYVFEAMESGHLTRILSADESRILTTVSTVPEEVRQPVDNASVFFKEAPAGDPERIDAWFFPGESIGNEFVYPKTGPEKKSSQIGSFGRETSHVTAEAIRTIVAPPEYLIIHVERAVVKSTSEVGHFFATRFLVA